MHCAVHITCLRSPLLRAKAGQATPRRARRQRARRAHACARVWQEAESKLRMVTSLWNVLDFLAIFPPLVELALLHGANVPFTLGRLDLRWFKILRRSPPRPRLCCAAAYAGPGMPPCSAGKPCCERAAALVFATRTPCHPHALPPLCGRGAPAAHPAMLARAAALGGAPPLPARPR